MVPELFRIPLGSKSVEIRFTKSFHFLTGEFDIFARTTLAEHVPNILAKVANSWHETIHVAYQNPGFVEK